MQGGDILEDIIKVKDAEIVALSGDLERSAQAVQVMLPTHLHYVCLFIVLTCIVICLANPEWSMNLMIVVEMSDFRE